MGGNRLDFDGVVSEVRGWCNNGTVQRRVVALTKTERSLIGGQGEVAMRQGSRGGWWRGSDGGG